MVRGGKKPGSKQFKQPKYDKQSLSNPGNRVVKQRTVENEGLIATDGWKVTREMIGKTEGGFTECRCPKPDGSLFRSNEGQEVASIVGNYFT